MLSCLGRFLVEKIVMKPHLAAAMGMLAVSCLAAQAQSASPYQGYMPSQLMYWSAWGDQGSCEAGSGRSCVQNFYCGVGFLFPRTSSDGVQGFGPQYVTRIIERGSQRVVCET